jgi:hypothetical protein
LETAQISGKLFWAQFQTVLSAYVENQSLAFVAYLGTSFCLAHIWYYPLEPIPSYVTKKCFTRNACRVAGLTVLYVLRADLKTNRGREILDSIVSQSSETGLPDGIFSYQKIPIWGNFWVSSNVLTMLERTFGIIYGRLVYFMANRYILRSFGISSPVLVFCT